MDELQDNKRGYMEIPVDIYTGLVERSQTLAIYEELMRGYNPVTLILAGKKHIRKKQKKEERALAAASKGGPAPAAPAGKCSDSGKMLSLLRAGWTKYDLAAEFNTDPETIVAWASRYSINPDKAEVPENE